MNVVSFVNEYCACLLPSFFAQVQRLLRRIGKDAFLFEVFETSSPVVVEMCRYAEDDAHVMPGLYAVEKRLELRRVPRRVEHDSALAGDHVHAVRRDGLFSKFPAGSVNIKIAGQMGNLQRGNVCLCEELQRKCDVDNHCQQKWGRFHVLI